MSEEETTPVGPDFAKRVPLSSVADGAMLLGHVHGEPVLLARRGDEVFAAEIDGQLAERDCTVTYRRSGKSLAVAVVHRDLAGLRAEVEFETAIAATS